MFGFKRKISRNRWKVNKKQAEKEHREYMNQSPEVLENLKLCKLYMKIFILAGIILSFLGKMLPNLRNIFCILISLCSCIILGTAFFFLSGKKLSNLKIRLVPLICLCFGWGMGMLFSQKIISLIFDEIVR